MRRDVLPLMLLALSLASCKGPTLEGRWRAKAAGVTGAETTMTFDAGRFASRVVTKSREMGTLVYERSGRYELQGADLTLSAATARFDTSGMTPAARAMAVANTATKTETVTTLESVETVKLEFSSGGRAFVKYPNGTTMTLERLP